MGILGVFDLVIAIRSWNSCTINKNVGRWPIGLVVFMAVIDSFSTSTQFKKETYDKVDLIVLAIGYFGALIWNIVGKKNLLLGSTKFANLQYWSCYFRNGLVHRHLRRGAV